MANKVTKTFLTSGTFTPPAGVKNITVTALIKTKGLCTQQNGAFAIDTNKVLRGWGANTGGVIGDNTTVAKSSPVLVVGGLSFQAVFGAPQPFTTLGLTTDGKLYGWGLNDGGQVGDGTTTNRTSPVPTAGNYQWQSAIVGSSDPAPCWGLTTGGGIYFWGRNLLGAGGTNDNNFRSSPTLIAGGLTFSKMAFSQFVFTMYGLTTDGKVYAWGAGTNGNLGDGTTVTKSSPVQVVGTNTYADIWAGPKQVFALDNTGLLWSWGQNTAGSLGVGDVSSRSSPTPVVGGIKFANIFTGTFSAVDDVFGIDANGQAYFWGQNANGSGGTNDNNSYSSPVPIAGSLRFSKIAIVNTSTSTTGLGLTTGGQMYSWGNNLSGILGDGTTVSSKSSPALVVGGLTFIDFSIAVDQNNNRATAYGLTPTGQLYAWGDNASGQIGDNTAVAKSSPVLVVGGYTFQPAPVYSKDFPFSVTPGTAYSVVLRKQFASFNGTLVSAAAADSITISYDQ